MSQRYVIDANVLFSAFISGKDLYQLLFSEHTIYLPDFAFVEAVALEFHLTLVTNDKTLYRGLKKRDFHRIMLLGDVINTLPRIQE